jgi:rare lipoprotein A (peptidoglycan hydrolase)
LAASGPAEIDKTRPDLATAAHPSLPYPAAVDVR